MSPLQETKDYAESRPFNGTEFLESIKDGREVWIYGEQVKDVTTHPAFRNTARMMARLYDALHSPAKKETLTTQTDTQSGGYTHRFFKTQRSTEELVAARDAIAEWARISYGWLGRTPDYKAGFLATLGANADFYEPFSENARRWYKEGQEKVLFLNHAFGNPPVARGTLRSEAQNLYLTVQRETDAGIVLSGAKTVATGSALTHLNLVATVGGRGPVVRKELAFTCLIPMNAPGVKLFCRPSYQMMASVVGSPFDYPLTSLMDENDAIFVCDEVLVPWENVLIYGDGKKANAFLPTSGAESGFMLQGCTRLAVKLDFIAGLLLKGLDMTGSIKYRGVQTKVGEVLAWRNLFWSLSDAMVHNPTPWKNGALLPNKEASLAYRVVAPNVYSQILQVFQDVLASGLIYINSHAADFKNPAAEKYLSQYVQGTDGSPAVERVKLMKLIWDAVGSEFATRHELFERNYAGNHDAIRLGTYGYAVESERVDQLKAFVEQFMDEYDVDGWRSEDLINPSDVNMLNKSS